MDSLFGKAQMEKENNVQHNYHERLSESNSYIDIGNQTNFKELPL
jgi:hypothetical protein